MEARDWPSALRIIDRELDRAPQDVDARAWRARVLTWSGQLQEAEKEYLELLKLSPKDPDHWLGLASLYSREEKTPEALKAIDSAVKLDPGRADLHVALARILRTAGDKEQARREFQKALHLDRANAEARAGIASLRGEPKHELRFSQDDDLFNFATANHDEWASLVSRWTPRWATSVAGDFYQRAGVPAGKYAASVTRSQPNWGAVTLGGAIAHDNTVIPRSEALFDLDHGWKIGERNFLRGLEFDYGQHWYWYQASRILTLGGTSILYFPAEWTFTLNATGARSAFSGTGAEWRPSGSGRLGFPLAQRAEKRLSGNLFFAAGTEDFARVDQIGRFASQTYGGGLRFQFTARQDVTGYSSYQKRTQGHTDTSFGLSYGLRF